MLTNCGHDLVVEVLDKFRRFFFNAFRSFANSFVYARAGLAEVGHAIRLLLAIADSATVCIISAEGRQGQSRRSSRSQPRVSAADYNPVTMSVRLAVRDLPHLRQALLSWYGKNGRDLPWRNTRDPYRILVSEVMLQQTRVAVVIKRYQRFLQRFPSVLDLARAKEASVLAEWSGLGYYRRARNLYATAKLIVSERKGELPRVVRGFAGVARYWQIHRVSRRQHCIRRSGCGCGWQCRARSYTIAGARDAGCKIVVSRASPARHTIARVISIRQ